MVAALMLSALLAVPASPVLAARTGPGAEQGTGDVIDDPAVQQAQERAARAREEAGQADEELQARRTKVEQASGELDQAAAAYEEVRSHHLRLVGERDVSEAKAQAASSASKVARVDFAGHVADTYKQTPLALRLSDLVLQADDPASALHRLEVLGRMSAASVERMHDARSTAALTVDDAAQHEVVTVGTETAAEQLRLAADDLSTVLETARQRAAGAQASLDEAELAVARADAEVDAEVDAAERRIERERRRQELVQEQERQQRARQLASDSSGSTTGRTAPSEIADRGERLPPTDGMFCPIGAPNGFSDTWRAPRSGGRSHEGVDMFAAHGMPLYAVTDGTARVSENRLGGLVINLHADSGDRYYYAHLSAVSVESGARVKAGEVIGANGRSGNARGTPPHLHWQRHPAGGEPVNPYPLARRLCR